MEAVEDIVIVGAGIAGLTASLGLHRLGVRSLVLESSDSLRVTGFALTTWTNAWKALGAVDIADSLRQQHDQLHGLEVYSIVSEKSPTELSFKATGSNGEHEVRCVQRRLLLEALERELPRGTIRYSSKVVSIEKSGCLMLVHLADGTILKSKVLIGCEGVNSVVAKWLGLKQPSFTGRVAIRGCSYYKSSHGFEPKLLQFMGKGIRSGFIPCDDKAIYWFLTYSPSKQDKELEENPARMKQFVLDKLSNLPDHVRNVVEITSLDSIMSSPLRYRHPWEMLWGNISKGNVCLAGDALHPMTPDIGQGGCSALEDGVVLARCLGEALLKKPRREEGEGTSKDEEDKEYERIRLGLEKYAKERKWRSFDLISTAYMVGFVQQSSSKILNFLRDEFFSASLAGLLLKKAQFDCGKLNIS